MSLPRKLGRPADQRRAMLRSMVTSLFEHERITTTVTRAKEARVKAEHLITLAKRGDLHSRRLAAAYLLDETVLKKLFDTIGPRYADRQGGYTRIVRIGPRKGDAAPMAILELV
jgi:large subunit ribosomal protein L17